MNISKLEDHTNINKLLEQLLNCKILLHIQTKHNKGETVKIEPDKIEHIYIKFDEFNTKIIKLN